MKLLDALLGLAGAVIAGPLKLYDRFVFGPVTDDEYESMTSFDDCGCPERRLQALPPRTRR